jgi:asparagine N-glycosylation enzyme membrane subunit Stt3
VAPAFLFMLLVPIQLSRRVRDRHPAVHRWNGRALVALGSILGPVGIAIGIVMPFGGPVELVVSSIIGIAFLVSLFMGVTRIRKKRVVEHRQWMVRMLAVGFVPVTMRGLMIAGVMLFDLEAPAIFGPTMLMGLVINVFVIELHLRRQRRIRQPGIATAGISPA